MNYDTKQISIALEELHNSKDVSDAAYSTLKFAIEQLTIHSVSQQRELLLAWEEQKYFDFDWVKSKEMVTAKIDKYLANNCD